MKPPSGEASQMNQQPSDTTGDQMKNPLKRVTADVMKLPWRRPSTISHARRTYWRNRFLRPGCIAPLPEDLERRRTKR